MPAIVSMVASPIATSTVAMLVSMATLSQIDTAATVTRTAYQVWTGSAVCVRACTSSTQQEFAKPIRLIVCRFSTITVFNVLRDINWMVMYA